MSLSGLISRLERASGPDRDLDGAIAVAVGPWTERHGPAGPWVSVGAGNAVIAAPHYTSSLDAAVTLVPADWFWRVGRTSIYQAWAGVHQTHPDHGIDGSNEFFWRREYWEPPSTPPIALCIAALRAVSVK